MQNMIGNEIFEEISQFEIFDTHEHIMYEEERVNTDIDFFLFFTKYASTDLVNAGLDEKSIEYLLDVKADFNKRWKIFYPAWENMKNTSYAKVVKIILRDLFDISEVNIENALHVSNILKENNKPGIYDYIIKKKCNIAKILNDVYDTDSIKIKETKENEIFLPVLRLDRLFELNAISKLDEIQNRYNVSIFSFKDFLTLIDKIFDSFSGNIFAFKIGAAYSRPIYFENSSFYEAERDFNKVLSLNNHDHHKDGIPLQQIKAFQDFVYHYCIEKSYDLGIPVQIHTGLLEGNYNNLNNSNPLLITNLLLKYKKINFDVFHMGYPYFHEIIAMAKMYPNMFVDMCWVSEISNKLYEESLDYIIDLIPSNKIMGFGGDYFFAEGIYGAQKMARMIISKVLAKRVERGDFTHKEAVDYSKKILFENPNKLYQKIENII